MSDNLKVIEFLGMPGSGKTTLCTQLLKQFVNANNYYESVDLTKKKLLARVLYKLHCLIKFTIIKPSMVFKIIRNIRKSNQEDLIDDIRLGVNFFFIYQLIHNSRKKDKKIMLDQGIFQAIWSVNLKSNIDVPLKEWMDILEEPDIVVFVRTEEHVIKKRLKDRQSNLSRLEKKDQQHNSAQLISKGNKLMDSLVHEMEYHGINVLKIENSEANDLNSNTELLKIRLGLENN